MYPKGKHVTYLARTLKKGSVAVDTVIHRSFIGIKLNFLLDEPVMKSQSLYPLVIMTRIEIFQFTMGKLEYFTNLNSSATWG